MSVNESPNAEIEQANLGLVFEELSDAAFGLVETSISEHGVDSLIVRAFYAVRDALREEDWTYTRVVITGDLVASVNSREDRSGAPFTRERGSGAVAAKTMPPNGEGIVDILIPAEILLSDPDEGLQRTVQHFAAHEAIHASLFHDGTNAFDVHARRKYGDALVQFVSMASHQTEEFLAEYLSRQALQEWEGITSQQIQEAFDSWNRTLQEKLPALSPLDPDYLQ